jgi:hypothetical protein
MKRFQLLLSVLLVVAIFMTSCTQDNESVVPVFALQNADSISSEEYAVYSTLLSQSAFSKTQYEVQQSTSTAIETNYNTAFYAKVKTDYPNVDTTVFEDYEKVNAQSFNLDNRFKISGKEIRLIASAELGYIFGSQDLNQNWKLFYSRYPDSGGVVEFTRVGFNKDKTQAVAQIICTSASLEASSQLLILAKVNTKWQIASIVSSWQSK